MEYVTCVVVILKFFKLVFRLQ